MGEITAAIGSITPIVDGGEIRGVGRDLEEVRCAGKRILGYGNFVILKYSSDVVDYW